jgi:hypothetical protein
VPIPPISYYYLDCRTVKSKGVKVSWPSRAWVYLQVDRFGRTNTSGSNPSLATNEKSRLRWVQTVYQGNQPLKGTPVNCVDPCHATDEDPFYYETKTYKSYEVVNGKKEPRHPCGSEGIHDECYEETASFSFRDTPSRKIPEKSMGVTQWRAVMSLVAVTNKRVTLVWSGKWGYDITPDGKTTCLDLSKVTDKELVTHLKLLHSGKGKDQDRTFRQLGWKFRLANPRQTKNRN